MHEGRNVYRVLDGKSEGKMALGRSRQTDKWAMLCHQMYILFE